MSGNILDYIDWRGDLSFENDPLNVVDAEILAHVVYNKIENFVSESFSEQIKIKDLIEKFKNSTDIKSLENMGLLINPKTPNLLYKCGDSERFGNIKICGVKSKLDFENKEQFAAFTFVIGKTAVVSFRGTDDYIIGWHEDFNIAFEDPIPGQKDALEYLNKVAKFFKNNIYIVGHSKGGNLALYAGANVDSKIQKRIKGIYNLDGPGFKKEFFASEGYLRIRNVVTSIYPSCDIVGMLFKHDNHYKIIKSEGRSVFQHDGMRWKVCGNHFETCKNFTEDSKIFERAFNEWCDHLTIEEKKKFVGALFDIFEAPEYKTMLEFSENTIKVSKKMIDCYSKMSTETKKEIKRISGAFMHVMKQEIPLLNFLN